MSRLRSPDTPNALFELEPRGRIEAKHERKHELFFLNRLNRRFSNDPDGHRPNERFAGEHGRLITWSPAQLPQGIVVSLKRVGRLCRSIGSVSPRT